MKKTMSLLLVLCLIMLSACAGENKSENSKEAVSNEDTTEISVEESSDVSALSEESSELSEESSELSEDSSMEPEDSSDESAEVLDVFCGGRFDGKENIKLVALGDSIARGYGLSTPETDAFPALLSDSIKSVLGETEVEYTNLAVDGLKTDGLLTLLESNSTALEGADIVVLSIGANNILGPFTTALLSSSSGLLDGFEGNTETLEAVVNGLDALLKNEQFEADLTAGIEKTKAEMPLVLQTIKKYAPDAIIAVMTVYSPYHGMVLSVPYVEKKVNLGEVSDKWVSLLNDEIKAAVESEGCVLVETYEAFAEGSNLVNAKIRLMPPKFSFDPHPNATGHKKLAELFMSVLCEQ